MIFLDVFQLRVSDPEAVVKEEALADEALVEVER
jgi:hypothetical protein